MNRHELDPLSLVFGLLFALVGGSFLFNKLSVTDVWPVWVWPAPVLALGLLLVLYGGKRVLRGREGEAEFESEVDDSPGKRPPIPPESAPPQGGNSPTWER